MKPRRALPPQRRGRPSGRRFLHGRSRSRRLAGCGGFSLVEVLCAILILGVGIAGLVQGLTTALASHKESERQTTAALLAASRIEMLQADGYLIEGEDDGDFDEHPKYHWRQTITETEHKGLYDVDVVIENSTDNQTIYELRTLLFDPPFTMSDDAGTTKPGAPNRKKEQKR